MKEMSQDPIYIQYNSVAELLQPDGHLEEIMTHGSYSHWRSSESPKNQAHATQYDHVNMLIVVKTVAAECMIACTVAAKCMIACTVAAECMIACTVAAECMIACTVAAECMIACTVATTSWKENDIVPLSLELIGGGVQVENPVSYTSADLWPQPGHLPHDTWPAQFSTVYECDCYDRKCNYYVETDDQEQECYDYFLPLLTLDSFGTLFKNCSQQVECCSLLSSFSVSVLCLQSVPGLISTSNQVECCSLLSSFSVSVLCLQSVPGLISTLNQFESGQFVLFKNLEERPISLLTVKSPAPLISEAPSVSTI